MKAFLKNYRQSPRKVRLVAGLLKGKRIADAFVHLNALSKRAAGPMQGLLSSAVANAKVAGVSEENLIVSGITVNKGIVLKRSMPRARGSASRINKRTSHIAITLIEKTEGKKIKPAIKPKTASQKPPKQKEIITTKEEVVPTEN